MNKEYYKKLIEQIIDGAWAIKIRDRKYRPSENFRMSINAIMKFVSYVDDEKEISGMIYYHYYMYLSVLDEL